MFSEYFSQPILLGSTIATILLVGAFLLALLRVVRGPTPFDRVLALDLMGGICLCALVMFAIRFDQQVLLDAAFVIALVSFMGTVAFARYLGKGGGE